MAAQVADFGAPRGETSRGHYIEFFKFVPTTVPPGVVPPISSTDVEHFDRAPSVEERESLLAHLRKL
jgi:hypothetical protein